MCLLNNILDMIYLGQMCLWYPVTLASGRNGLASSVDLTTST